MAKKLIHNYTFTASANTVVINEVIKEERLLLITNVNSGIPIYLFNDPAKKFNSITHDYTNETTTLVLEYNCNPMNDADHLQIFIESDANIVEMSDTFVDAVSKLRVSTPENLIDTDFEYGLQSTKWETLERVKNIPTFFSRTGDDSLALTSMSTISGSDIVTVTTVTENNFAKGYPVLIVGSKNITCDGGFVVTNIITEKTFQYKSKGIQNFTGSILDTYTQVFPASKYQGTEFKLDTLNSIVTDSAVGSSKITVTTEAPTNFSNATSFFLTNSVSKLEERIDASNNIVSAAFTAINRTVNNSTPTGEGGGVVGSTFVDDYEPTEVFYFNMSDVTFSGSPNYTMTFTTPHGFDDNVGVVWFPGAGQTLYTTGAYYNTNFGSGQMYAGYGYWLRRVDDYTFYLQKGPNNTGRIIITQPTIPNYNNQITKSAFARSYVSNYIGYYLSNHIYFNLNWNFPSNSPDLVAGSSDPIGIFRGNPYYSYQSSWGGLSYSNGLQSAFGQPNATTIRDANSGLYSYAPYVYYPGAVVQRGIGNNIAIRTTPGFGTSSLTSGTFYGHVVKLRLSEKRNSFYVPQHGFNTNDRIRFSANSGSSVPIGTSNTSTYSAEIVDDNRIRLKSDTGTTLNFTSVGSSSSQLNFQANTNNSLSDTIFISDSLLSDNTVVTYNANGNSVIPGLSNNSTYYVYQKQNNRFRLTTTEGGTIGPLLTFNQISSSYTSDFIYTGTHGLTSANNGQLVVYNSTTPIGGLSSGQYYYIRYYDTTRFRLYTNYDSAVAGTTDYINFSQPTSGTGTLQLSSVVDLGSPASGEHFFEATEFGAADGVYRVSNQLSSNTFEMTTNSTIKSRNYTIQPNTSLSFKHNSFYVPQHGFSNETIVTYETTGTAIGGLTNTSTYYAIVESPDWFALSNTEIGVSELDKVPLIDFGTGTHTISTNSISGEKAARGTVTVSNTETLVTGTNTNFTAVFTGGDNFIVYIPANTVTTAVTVTNASNVFTVAAGHNYTNGDMVKIAADVLPTGLTSADYYYIYAPSSTTFTLHTTYVDALTQLNTVSISTDGTNVTSTKYNDLGVRYVDTIDYVNGQSQMSLKNPVTSTFTDYEYAIRTNLLIRSDGFALHRPYDGGVELIPSTNPDGNMLRQTRKYFRYQSGKGIQVSLAVNFSPTTTIDTYNRIGTTATITTRYPHRLSAGLNVVVSGASTTDPVDYWNGEFTINTVSDYSFTFDLSGTPTTSAAAGLVEFHVKEWTNSLLRCGLFDDQNGLFFEYDGSILYCVRRSSTSQISGTVTTAFKSSLITGTNTKFQSQLYAGERIVIKGQTYLITQIDSDTQMHVLPSYIGTSTSGSIITKTVDTKVRQSQWNIDKADGTGPTGFYLDINKIQMAYIDYSWYGAGKVRFGFKDQHGIARYFHEFVHANKQTEAYMRSGNLPCRYEILNVGQPTYVPALAHWGTSVIMDGRFDDDKAYVFTASSTPFNITGQDVIDVTGRIETTSYYYNRSGNSLRTIGYALDTSSNAIFNGISEGLLITGAGLQSGTKTANPISASITPYQPYLPAIYSSIGYSSVRNRNLIVLDRQPESVQANGAYTITLPTTTSVTGSIPLMSIRLAPSVDTGSPGLMGEREIINRMQLILSSVGILSTHSVEIQLVLNATLSTNSWQRVNNPSLSQLIYHSNADTIYGGAVAYSFRAQGGTGITGRTQQLTQQDLGEVATLGNSILGGNSAFPDGPDVLTVVARLIEDASTVSTSNPFEITGRISWAESQA